MIGQVIGNYRIVSELGKGGMGMVYRAEHVQLGRPAALKMLLPQLSADPGIVQRFFNEARAASAIDHPGIVEVYDFGTHTDGAAYIVMALLKGESLEQRLQRGALPPIEGASIVAQVLGALAAAHARGIIHRDLKPDNIFLTPNELMPGGIQVKLLDFGIAKLADEKSAGFKTQTGMMMGTPAYMSPEQCMGKADLDHRTDLYAIGCILFHVLTGRPPFISDQGTGMMIAAHIRDTPAHPRAINPNIPDALAAITMRLLEKEPAARYQTALEARQALVEAGASSPSKPPAGFDQYAATMAPTPSLGGVATPTVRYGPQGRSYSPAASAPTTASGSAAQVMPMTQAAPATTGNKAGVYLGVVVLLAALGGVGVWAAMRRDGDTRANDSVQPAGKPELPAPAGQPPAPQPVGDVIAAGTEPCPLGQVRGFDTHGHCCWPEQAYSTAKNKCVGKPACPDGHAARGDDCTVVAAATQDRPVNPPPHGSSASPPPPPQQPVPSGPAPSFTLDAKSYVPGASIVITFASPVSSPSASRAWITVVDAKLPASQYGAWTYIEDGATTAKLTAPDQPGAYEVRMHTDYPAKSHNLRHSVAVTIGAKGSSKAAAGSPRNDQRFMLASKVARVGEHIEITFPVAMKAPDGEKFWITIVAKGAADTAYGTYAYVPDGARTMQFEMPATAGEYEIRLHANYPRLSTNLVHRAPVRVED